MAGSLIKIDEEIVSSAVASVTLTGIDSTYDVYMVRYSLNPVSDAQLRVRFTVSGVADTSSNYDFAQKYLKSDTSFSNNSDTNDDQIDITATMENAVTGHSGILYLFNFNNASEYSFITQEGTFQSSTGARGLQGGAVLTETQATDGIQFFMTSGNIASGTFTLYGLKK